MIIKATRDTLDLAYDLGCVKVERENVRERKKPIHAGSGSGKAQERERESKSRKGAVKRK